MSNLKNIISDLADDFAKGVLGAIRSASLEEILDQSGSRSAKSIGGARRTEPVAPAPTRATSKSPARKSGERLHRRSEEELGAIGGKIVALLKANPEGLRAEQIRAELSLEAKELPRPIKDLLSGKKIKTKGQKRATTYFAR